MTLGALLTIDAAYCAVIGLAFAIGGTAIAAWAGLPAWLVIGLGVGIAVHAGVLWWGRRDRVVAVSRYAAIANGAWIVAAAIVLAMGQLPNGPAVVFAALSVGVAVLGALQVRALRPTTV